MTDLALSWNPSLLAWDLALNAAGTDLALDDSLYPAIVVSLLSDRLADLDDVLPGGDTGRIGGDRRGYWGDVPLPGAPDTPTPDLIGSRLWLLSRAKQTSTTLRNAEAYAAEALSWMLEDDVAQQVSVVASYPQLGWMNIRVNVVRGSGSTSYDVAWSATAVHAAIASAVG